VLESQTRAGQMRAHTDGSDLHTRHAPIMTVKQKVW